jgi:hypothetical protein
MVNRFGNSFCQSCVNYFTATILVTVPHPYTYYKSRNHGDVEPQPANLEATNHCVLTENELANNSKVDTHRTTKDNILQKANTSS